MSDEREPHIRGRSNFVAAPEPHRVPRFVFVWLLLVLHELSSSHDNVSAPWGAEYMVLASCSSMKARVHLPLHGAGN